MKSLPLRIIKKVLFHFRELICSSFLFQTKLIANMLANNFTGQIQTASTISDSLFNSLWLSDCQIKISNFFLSYEQSMKLSHEIPFNFEF